MLGGEEGGTGGVGTGSCRFGADNPPLRLILFERVIPSHLIISIAPQTAF